MRSPKAEYDHTLNLPSVNQQQAIKAFFAIIQELRLQASEHDVDSPGELTSAEILSAAITKFPEGAAAIMALMNDNTAIGTDVMNVAVGVVQQLDPLSPSSAG